ncbi:ABC transporter B family protein [Heterostelium album PN500]|uniref:ABC transporter B family protein n=1 Tax=Heterostelium pallidum (strain ATCC 26659 / Pp 5 / PN500) TaxID=670386 RepID=D3BQP2_HETP5|nr:ABC transporter B family protein [Heterostelium album PN500]EFA76462.1 ABC transporter B family protein [Heterostelium album PN500]|eukprot:XP_020428594.1 ABC transporter B family protein [Heterostelium album PN500]
MDENNNNNNFNEVPMEPLNSNNINLPPAIHSDASTPGRDEDVVIALGSSSPKKTDEVDKPPVEDNSNVGFFQLFRFADGLDCALMIVGSIGAIAAGVALPALSIVLGKVMNVFTYQELRRPDFDVYKEISAVALYFVYIAIGMFFASYLEVACWSIAGERQSVRCRKQYLKAILRQEIGWYDVTKSSELATRIASNTQLFQEAIGEKVGNFLHFTSTFISGFIIGLVNGWQLALVIIAVTPLLAACGAFMTKMMTDLTKKGQDAYAKAGAVAEEKIGSIRTVATFSGEERENARYAANLNEALKIGRKKGVYNGLGIGSVFFVMFASYSLAFWYGAKLITDKTYNPVAGRDWQGSDVLTVFFSVIMVRNSS